MKIAITGGTGFIGRHLARDLVEHGHQVVVISRGLYKRGAIPLPTERTEILQLDVNDTDGLARAVADCQAVAHCAGAAAEEPGQTFEQLHVEGTRSVVQASERAGIRKLVLVSFLNVRPGTESRYYSSKWEGEEIVRHSRLNYAILKAGLVYGPGDHLLHNLGNLLRKMPVFATVGMREHSVRLVAVQDLVAIIRAVLLDEKLFSKQTVAVVGPEEFPFSTAPRRIAQAMGKPFLIVLPFPVAFQRALAWFSEKFMPVPLIGASQVQMLAEGISAPQPGSLELPPELRPKTSFTEEQIRRGLPQ